MEISSQERDVLSELANIGANAAATALAQMAGKKVELSVPSIQIKDVQDVKGGAGNLEEKVAAVYIGVFERNSAILVTFPEKSALRLVDVLLGKKPGASKEIRDAEKSAFDEMGNILVGAYLAAIANFLKTKIAQGVPHSAVDMSGALLDAAIVQIATGTNEVLVTDANFSIEKHVVGARIYFLFEPGVVRSLLLKAKKI